MYHKKPKQCAGIAVGYYALLMISYLCMGMLYEKGKSYSEIYWLLFALAVAIVLLRDKSPANLGFSGTNLKVDICFFSAMIAVTVAVAFLFSDKQEAALLRGVFYYLIRIALVEEVVFRGFLQSYLFEIPAKRRYIFLFGALCFSLMHLPFQMYVNHMASPEYLLIAWPQLLFTFGFHLLMCFITDKRGNILIPTALHFALDYLQAAL